MRHLRQLAVSLSWAILPAIAASQQASPSAPPANPVATPVIPPLIIIAPTEVRSNPTLAEGCWVRLFPETNFKGVDDLTIAGPLDVPSLHSPAGGAAGMYWKSRAESVIAGPRARITVFENKEFRGPSSEIAAGSQVTQLRKEHGFPQSIDSLRIRCQQ